MKKIAIVLAAAFFTAVSVQAQNTDKVQRERKAPNKDWHADLNLSDKQKKEIASLNKEFRSKNEVATKANRELMKKNREQSMKLRKERDDKFKALLTPEQKELYTKKQTALKEKRKEYRGNRGGKRFGAPKQAKENKQNRVDKNNR